MKDLTKAREGLKECWKGINKLCDVIPNSDALKIIKLSIKDVEYGYEDCIKNIFQDKNSYQLNDNNQIEIIK